MVRIGASFIFLAGLVGCIQDASNYPPLATADNFDLTRYLGKWYEIAKYPVFFEIGCSGVTAEYTLREDGTVRVLNICRNEEGVEKSRIVGTAVPTDPDDPAKLGVSFAVVPIQAPYWVLEVGANYEFAVVGAPNRRTLWILSRTPSLDASVYEAILARLPEYGYDPDRLELTFQPSE
ncbi:MAG: hypothetical protein AMXMBFR13_28390 [Phycisphaerae bacterium]